MARRAPERPRHRRGRRLLVPAGDEPGPGGRIPRRAHPGRGAVRHRHGEGQGFAASAHDAAPGGFRLGDARARHRRRHEDRRLRRRRPVLGAAGLVDVPHLRRARRLGPRRRLPGLDGRGAPDRRGSAKAAQAAPLHRPPRPFRRRRPFGRAPGARDRRGAGRRHAPGRALPRRGAGAAPGPALRSHARRAQPPLLVLDRERPAEAGGGVAGADRSGRNRSRASDRHELRLRRLRRDPDARARSHRPPGEGALRRLLGGMGRAGGCAGGDRAGHGQLGNRQFGTIDSDCPMPTAVSAGSGSGTASCARAGGS